MKKSKWENPGLVRLTSSRVSGQTEVCLSGFAGDSSVCDGGSGAANCNPTGGVAVINNNCFFGIDDLIIVTQQ